MYGVLIMAVSVVSLCAGPALASEPTGPLSGGERLALNFGWRFTKGDPALVGDELAYTNIKDWILPTRGGLRGEATLDLRPDPLGNPGADGAYVRSDFDGRLWQSVNLPHDWAIQDPCKQEYPGETGKLEWWGVGWYRKDLTIPATDAGRMIFLDVDGVMSYATVWLNGRCVGGWPYGCPSWRVDLTKQVKFGSDNVLAIRLDHPNESSRWYPGAGIYRNGWLVKSAPVLVAHWGVAVTMPAISEKAATVKVTVCVDHDTDADAAVTVKNEIFELNSDGTKGKSVAKLPPLGTTVDGHQSLTIVGQVTPAQVYTSGDAAELFLKGKSLGRKQKGPFECRLCWDNVVYEPGELKVVADKNGRTWAMDAFKTASSTARLTLAADHAHIMADGQGLAFVTVSIVDTHGLVVPRSKSHLQFTLEGPRKIAAVDNGDATSFEPLQAKERNACNGKALVIVRSQRGVAGNIVLKASSSGLNSAQIKTKSEPIM